MKIIENIKILVVAVLLLLASASCNKELDNAPFITFDGSANMTIAELLALHQVSNVDSYDSIPDGTIICGIITSSDAAGNCYKFITIQDETGGIQIKIDDSSLFPKYQIGQKVYVKCGDMVIGDYRKNKQIGFWVDGAMSGISSSQEDLYIFRDGLVGEEPAAIEISSANQITDGMINCLVKLQNCQFENAGQLNYCDDGTSTSRNIVFADNSSIVLRTSNYADFAYTLLPEGTGVIYGILTTYNTTRQLVIRSTADVQLVNTHTETIASVDFSSNPLETQGWTELATDNTNWFYYAIRSSFAIQGGTNTTDSWLISPAYSNFGNAQIILNVDQNILQGADPTKYRIYCSTTFNGSSADESEWTEITPGEVLPTEMTSNPNFRIAFRYQDSGTNKFWEISGIRFNAIVVR